MIISVTQSRTLLKTQLGLEGTKKDLSVDFERLMYKKK